MFDKEVLRYPEQFTALLNKLSKEVEMLKIKVKSLEKKARQ